jgi:hypothetical protein
MEFFFFENAVPIQADRLLRRSKHGKADKHRYDSLVFSYNLADHSSKMAAAAAVSVPIGSGVDEKEYVVCELFAVTPLHVSFYIVELNYKQDYGIRPDLTGSHQVA